MEGPFRALIMHTYISGLIRRGCRPREFVLGHCLGGSPTVYSVNGWVKAAQPNVSEGSVLTLLHSSREYGLTLIVDVFFLSMSYVRFGA